MKALAAGLPMWSCPTDATRPTTPPACWQAASAARSTGPPRWPRSPTRSTGVLQDLSYRAGAHRLDRSVRRNGRHGETRCSMDRFQGVRRHHRGVGSCGSPGGSRRAGHPARSTGARPVVGSCPSDTTHGMNRPDLPDRPHPWVVPGADHDPSRTRAGTRWGTAWWRPQLPPAGPLSGDVPTPAGPSVPGEPTANQRVDIRIIPFQRGGLVVKPPIAGLGCAGSSRGSISGDPGPAPGRLGSGKPARIYIHANPMEETARWNLSMGSLDD
jgi:hypothetical protein